MKANVRRWAAVLGAIVAASVADAADPESGPAFTDRAWRLELYQVGDAKEEFITLHRVVEEPVWPENPGHQLSPFELGRYAVKVIEIASNRLLFNRGFDSMFGEYKTTTPAIEGVRRVFEKTVRIPAPRRPVRVLIERRDIANILHPLFTAEIDPADYHIVKESPAMGDRILEIQTTGEPWRRVDFVFLSEGYAAEDADKFQADAARFTSYLFGLEPYKGARDRFNVRAVFRPSPERSMDEPRQGSFKATVLDASFNAFDLDRYMLIEANHRMHRMAAQVPYDAIIVLVNSRRYGGGSIGFDYCVTTTDHSSSLQVFVHELGHSFAGLADEYYASEVSYNDFYPKGIEPLEPNITALLDPSNIKWKDLVSPGIALPTPYGKEEIEALQAERQKLRKALAERKAAAAKSRGGEGEDRAAEAEFQSKDKELSARIDGIRKSFAGLEDKVGAFEGAGYASRGLYRPQMHCLMISSPKNEFCRVCQKAIRDTIDFFAGSK